MSSKAFSVAATGFGLLLLVAMPLSYGLQQQQKPKTPGTSIKCNNKTLEEEILKITGALGDPHYTYPATDADFNKYCRSIRTSTQFVKDFSQKCSKLSSSSKTVLSVFSYTTNQVNKKYCGRKNTKVREEMVQVAKCFNPNKQSSSQCYQEYMDRFQLARTVQPNKDKFQYMCCLTEQMKECLLEGLRNSKHPDCTDEVIQSYGRLFDSFSGNLFNLSCDNFEDQADRCQNLIERELKNAGYPAKSLPRNPWKTPFPVVLGIFDSIQ